MTVSHRFKSLIAASTIPFMVACSEEPATEAPVQISRYENVKECAAEGKLTEAQCTAAFETAKKQHEQHRPRFTTKEDCEKDFGAGKCEIVPQSSAGSTSTPSTHTQTQQSSFAPFFMGWMVGNMLSNSGSGSGAPGFSATPLYKTQRNNFVTPSGRTFDANTRTASPSAFKTPEKPAPVVQPGKTFSETVKPAPAPTQRYTPQTAQPTERYTPPAGARSQQQTTSPQRTAPTPAPAPQRAAPAPSRSPSPSPSRSFSSPSRSGGFGGGGGSR